MVLMAMRRIVIVMMRMRMIRIMVSIMVMTDANDGDNEYNDSESDKGGPRGRWQTLSSSENGFERTVRRCGEYSRNGNKLSADEKTRYHVK